MSNPEEAQDSWRTRWTRRTTVHAVLVVIIAAIAVAHQSALWQWFIEDAAITFAYSKHLAMGEGLVPYMGGERVEGYSNPTWTFLLAGFHWLGFDLFEATKWIQAFMGFITVPVVYMAARETQSEENEVPLIAAGVLAANAQFAIWGGAGLENGLLNLLMALALWRSFVEWRTNAVPLSSFLWLLVAISRPEAIAYSAVAGFVAMIASYRRHGSVVRTLQWLAIFFIPFGLYHAIRFNYFAYEFPNTYYAKLDHHYEKANAPTLLDWKKRGWNYIRNWGLELGNGFFMPAYFLGTIGHKKWRFATAIVLTLVLGGLIQFSSDQRFLLHVIVGCTFGIFWSGLSYGGEKPHRAIVGGGLLVSLLLIGGAELARYYGFEPNQLPFSESLISVPAVMMMAFGLLLPLLGYGTKNWEERALLWWLSCAAAMFGVYALGDWMKGFRWLATAAVPSSILLGMGIDAMARVLGQMFEHTEDRWGISGAVGAVVLVAAFVPANALHTQKIAEKPDTRPQHIHTRVKYVNGIRDRLHHWGKWRDLDVDQGGHLWWSDFEMLDIAGLIDVPMAQHKFQRPFIKEYLFEQMKPEYAHVHGAWATNSRIPTHAAWKSDYVEIPGYPAGNQFHVGNHVRKDLIMAPTWPYGPKRRVDFDGNVTLEGVMLPASPAAKRVVYVEVGVSLRKLLPKNKPESKPRMVLFLASAEGEVASWDIPLGYDWLPPEEWRVGQVFHGKFSLPLPPKVAEGTYDVGVVFFAGNGRVLGVSGWDEEKAQLELPDGAVVGGMEQPARYAKGEIVFPGALKVISVERREEVSMAGVQEAVELASEGDCVGADRRFWRATRHRSKDKPWIQEQRLVVEPALASCFAKKAATETDRDAKVMQLQRAREFNRWDETLASVGGPFGDELYAEGVAAMEEEDWETAYARFMDVLRFDRTRAWARRYGEEARAFRLGIDPESKAEKAAEEKARREEMLEKREKAKREREKKLKEREEAGDDEDDAKGGERRKEKEAREARGEEE